MDYMNIEGLTIEVEKTDDDKRKENDKKRIMAYMFRAIREQTDMNRKDFAEWLGIPYRTMQDWELAKSQVPEYVMRLVAYKVKMEKAKGNI